MRDAAEATDRAKKACESAESFSRDAVDARKRAKKAICDAEDAAKEAEDAAARVVAATKRTVDGAKALASGFGSATSRPFASNAPAQPSQLPPQPPTPTLPIYPGMRPTDEITAAVAQLNSLVVGTTPAFATAMRLATDAMASGIASQNAVSHQANQNITALLMQLRASSNLIDE